MINRVVLVGRLTRDPELKFTQSGLAVCRFTLAVNRPFRNQQGENEADFINCVTWRKTAENVANYLTKGSLAGVDGRIQTSNFEGRDGNRVFMTEVVAESVQFLEPKRKNESPTDPFPVSKGENNFGNYGTTMKEAAKNNNNHFGGSLPDDDLPF
ncbi:single-stranded DNA-binding protein [Planococcaceae bacterium Storch 2/2-2]|nr:single-stranded DNA-binding protein [Planococcaceae bacterium Storch 2/2-2]